MAANDATQDKPVPVPRWEVYAGQLAVLAAGVALIVAGISFWSTDQGPTVSSVTTSTMTTTTKPATSTAQAHASKGKRSKSNAGTRSAVTKSTSTTVTTTMNGPASQAAQAKAPQSVSRRSETLAISLVSLGAALVFAAAVLTRLRSLTLPGGATFTLDPATTAQIIQRVDEKSAGAGLSDAQKQQARIAALRIAQARPSFRAGAGRRAGRPGLFAARTLRAEARTPSRDELIDGIASEAVETVTPPP